jgi:hypothetical protein
MGRDHLPLVVTPLVSTEMSPSEALELEQQAIAMLRAVAAAGLLRRELVAALRLVPED